MIPGKRYKPEDVLAMAWRRRWHVLVPFVLVAIGTAVVARMLPDQYSAQATILIVPQRVPEAYVTPTVTSRVEDRVRTIAQQILSRTELEQIILEFNLFAAERRTMVMEDVVGRMRENITVQVGQQGPVRRPDSASFQIGYTAPDARTATKVTERLASLFISENLRDREVMADGTTRFLESQLNDARERLVEQEHKVEEYRRQYANELPTQQQVNVQIIQTTQAQIQALTDAMERERDRKMALERTLADIAGDDDQSGAALDDVAVAELEAAKAALTEMKRRLKPEHPDVVRQTRLVRDLDARVAARASSPADKPALTPAAAARQNRRAALQAEIAALEKTLASQTAEATRLGGVIKQYKGFVDAAPKRESEMIALTRDYETLQRVYTTLLAKNEDAKVAANLERRQIGEQFKLIDPPALPEQPTSPDRAQIDMFGAVAGLVIGCLLAAVAEYRDTSLRTADDVLTALSLPVLAMIPVLPHTKRGRGRWRRMTLVTAGTLAGAALVTAIVWKFVQ